MESSSALPPIDNLLKEIRIEDYFQFSRLERQKARRSIIPRPETTTNDHYASAAKVNPVNVPPATTSPCQRTIQCSQESDIPSYSNFNQKVKCGRFLRNPGEGIERGSISCRQVPGTSNQHGKELLEENHREKHLLTLTNKFLHQLEQEFSRRVELQKKVEALKQKVFLLEQKEKHSAEQKEKQLHAYDTTPASLHSPENEKLSLRHWSPKKVEQKLRAAEDRAITAELSVAQFEENSQTVAQLKTAEMRLVTVEKELEFLQRQNNDLLKQRLSVTKELQITKGKLEAEEIKVQIIEQRIIDITADFNADIRNLKQQLITLEEDLERARNQQAIELQKALLEVTEEQRKAAAADADAKKRVSGLYATMEQALAAKSTQIATLTKALSLEQEEKAKLMAEVMLLKADKNDKSEISQILASSETRIKQLTQTIQEALAKERQAERMQAAAEAEASAHRSNAERVTAELKLAQAELKLVPELRDEIQKLQRDINDVVAKKAVDVEKLTLEINNVKAQNSKYIQELAENKKTLEMEQNKFYEEKNRLEMLLDNHEKQNTSLSLAKENESLTITQLETELTKTQKSVNQLNTELETIKRTNENLEQQIEELSQNNQRLKAEVESTAIKLRNALEKEEASRTELDNTLAKQLENKEDTIQDLTHELEVLHEKLNVFEDQIQRTGQDATHWKNLWEQLNQQLDNLQIELHDQKQLTETLKGETPMVNEQLEQLQKDYSAKTQAYENLLSKNAILEEQSLNDKQQADKLFEENNKLISRIEEANAIIDANTKSKDSHTDIERLQKDNEQATSVIRQELEAATEEINQLKQQIENQTSQLGTAKQYQELLKTLEEENKTLKNKIVDFEEKEITSGVSADVMDISKMRNETDATILAMQHKLETAEKQVVELKQEMEPKIEQLQLTVDEQKEFINHLERDNERLTDMLEKRGPDIEKSESGVIKDTKEIQTDVQFETNELERLTKDLEESEQEKESIKESFAGIQNTLEKQLQENNALQSIVEDLQKKLSGEKIPTDQDSLIQNDSIKQNNELMSKVKCLEEKLNSTVELNKSLEEIRKNDVEQFETLRKENERLQEESVKSENRYTTALSTTESELSVLQKLNKKLETDVLKLRNDLENTAVLSSTNTNVKDLEMENNILKEKVENLTQNNEKMRKKLEGIAEKIKQKKDKADGRSPKQKGSDDKKASTPIRKTSETGSVKTQNEASDGEETINKLQGSKISITAKESKELKSDTKSVSKAPEINTTDALNADANKSTSGLTNEANDLSATDISPTDPRESSKDSSAVGVSGILSGWGFSTATPVSGAEPSSLLSAFGFPSSAVTQDNQLGKETTETLPTVPEPDTGIEPEATESKGSTTPKAQEDWFGTWRWPA